MSDLSAIITATDPLHLLVVVVPPFLVLWVALRMFRQSDLARTKSPAMTGPILVVGLAIAAILALPDSIGEHLPVAERLKRLGEAAILLITGCSLLVCLTAKARSTGTWLEQRTWVSSLFIIHLVLFAALMNVAYEVLASGPANGPITVFDNMVAHAADQPRAFMVSLTQFLVHLVPCFLLLWMLFRVCSPFDATWVSSFGGAAMALAFLLVFVLVSALPAPLGEHTPSTGMLSGFAWPTLLLLAGGGLLTWLAVRARRDGTWAEQRRWVGSLAFVHAATFGLVGLMDAAL